MLALSFAADVSNDLPQTRPSITKDAAKNIHACNPSSTGGSRASTLRSSLGSCDDGVSETQSDTEHRVLGISPFASWRFSVMICTADLIPSSRGFFWAPTRDTCIKYEMHHFLKIRVGLGRGPLSYAVPYDVPSQAEQDEVSPYAGLNLSFQVIHA